MLSVTDQIEAAYRQMAGEARYRPSAPSDGLGTITVPLAELDLDVEATTYAHRWNRDEDSMEYWVGCCDYATRPAVIFAIKAVRNLNAGMFGRATALTLLKMAVTSLEAQKP